jgi:hypothetical protein
MGIDFVAMIRDLVLVVFQLFFLGVDLIVDQTYLFFQIDHKGL